MTGSNLSRRDFLNKTCLLAPGLFLPLSLWSKILNTDIEELIREAPVARFWTSTKLNTTNCLDCHTKSDINDLKKFDHGQHYVKCQLCAQHCIIAENERGQCGTRINDNGQLRSLVYGRPVSMHIDPIEKKPLYHFLPASSAFSLATVGCPLSCKFCQNWQISQARPEDYDLKFTPPSAIVDASESRNVPVIAYTYNEPTVFFEYMADIANEAKKYDIKSVLISCGFMNPEPLAEMCEFLDGIKIDLKGFSPDFYRSVCGAELKPVLNSLKQISKRNMHLEIVNLVVPTLNDSDKMLNDLAEWIFDELGPDIPVHFTRFHPDYKLRHLPPTPVKTLENARNIAMDKGIRYAFVGNVPGHKGNHTYCPSCGKIVIRRSGFFIAGEKIVDGKCAYCDFPIAGVWN